MENENLNKVAEFFKKNVYNLALVLVSVIFVFKDMITITESGKSVKEIIASSAISLIMGIIFSTIMSRKGMQKALESDSYIACMNEYAKQVEATNGYIDKLDEFCDVKNDERLKRIQTNILRKARIKYTDFIENNMNDLNLTEDEKKVWKKAENAKLQLLTADNLLSETDDRYDKGKKELTLAQYTKRKDLSNLASKVMFAVIFGYFTTTLAMTNVANLIWGLIQVSTWLMFGLMNYINDMNFINNVYKQKIHRKINYLIEFNNKYKGGNANGNQ